jgi:hypothetical protein
MTESKSQSRRSLIKAEAVLRAQWPEVLQYLGDRSTLRPTLSHDLSVAHPSLSLASDQVTGTTLAMPSPKSS